MVVAFPLGMTIPSGPRLRAQSCFACEVVDVCYPQRVEEIE